MKQMETPEEKRARRLAKKVCLLIRFVHFSLISFVDPEHGLQSCKASFTDMS